MSSKGIKKEIVDTVLKIAENDLRIAQIMSNVFYEISKDGTDPFFVEDEKLLEHLKKYANN